MTLRLRSLPTRMVFLCALVFVLTPVAVLFYGSFHIVSDRDIASHFTLANWLKVYGTGEYWQAFLNTTLLSAIVAALALVLGTALAWIVARTDAPWRRLLTELLVVPLMVSNLVTTLAWIALAAPNAGFINALAHNLFGIRVLFDIYSFSGVVLVLVLHYASFAFLPLVAAFRSIDASLEEASQMMGAGRLRTALRVTVPLIWPSLVSTFLLVFIFVSENFSTPTLLLSSQGFHTLASSIFYLMSVEPAQPQLAASAGTMLIWIALIGTVWQRRISANGSRYVSISGKGSRVRQMRLGRWRYAASAFVVAYLLFSVGLPYCALILASLLKFVTPRLTTALFTTSNYTGLLTADNLAALRNSVLLAALGGFIATGLYVGLAYLVQRSRSLLAFLVDYAVILPTVMPGLVLGIGMLWTFVGVPLPIYGTIWILAIAYVVRFAGQGVRQSRAAFTQISDQLVEAARMCGASPPRAFTSIVLPLLKPAFISLWTILFILIFMEISMTIILYSPSSMTLSVLLWTSMAAGFQTEAFAIAAVQATIVFAILYVSKLLFADRQRRSAGEI